jgi:hypothetical protein
VAHSPLAIRIICAVSVTWSYLTPLPAALNCHRQVLPVQARQACAFREDVGN